MDLVKETKYERDNSKFVAFIAHFSDDEIAYRIIRNNEHYNSTVCIKNGREVSGEDPRPFILHNQRYILSQYMVDTIKNMHINVVNYDTGEQSRYVVNEPDFNYGKNWVPFVFNDLLYIIYRFDPFTVICNGNIIVSVPTNLPKCSIDNFTSYRGGTNGMVSSGADGRYIFGIGHNAPVLEDHFPFIWVIDTVDNTLEIADLEEYNRMYILADPTSIWNADDGAGHASTYVSIFESSHSWWKESCSCASRIYKLDFATLYSKCKTYASYRRYNMPQFLSLNL